MSNLGRIFHEKALFVLILFLGLLLLDPLVPASLTMWPFAIIGLAGAWLLSEKGSFAGTLVLFPTLVVLFLAASLRLFPGALDQAARVPIGILFMVCVLILYAYCMVQIVSVLMRAEEVTHHLIIWSVSLYIVLGIFWAHIYTILNMFHPEAFSMNVQQKGSASDFVYFSFVTLTSLGYGDITPRTEVAQRLAITEVITGQFYLAVVVAYLMNLFMGRKFRRVDESSPPGDDPRD